MSPSIREARPSDRDGIWLILEPILRAGETYALPPDWGRDDALAYWFKSENKVFVATDGDQVIGTYYLHPNQMGGGVHVANCGFATGTRSEGRGVASMMCGHALKTARESGFLAMQFNFVISSNERAVALWQRFGFEIVGRLPSAFRHPRLGFVDALVMYRSLSPNLAVGLDA